MGGSSPWQSSAPWWSLLHWIRRPEHRPWRKPADQRTPGAPWTRVVSVVAVVAIVGASGWCLRGLATPTVGFNTFDALWLMRAGWFLQSHQRLLTDMRPTATLSSSRLPIHHSSVRQPPWPGASLAITGCDWGVVIIALLNTCALGVAALALVAAGRPLRPPAGDESIKEAVARSAAPPGRPS